MSLKLPFPGVGMHSRYEGAVGGPHVISDCVKGLCVCVQHKHLSCVSWHVQEGFRPRQISLRTRISSSPLLSHQRPHVIPNSLYKCF